MGQTNAGVSVSKTLLHCTKEEDLLALEDSAGIFNLLSDIPSQAVDADSLLQVSGVPRKASSKFVSLPCLTSLFGAGFSDKRGIAFGRSAEHLPRHEPRQLVGGVWWPNAVGKSGIFLLFARKLSRII